MARTLPALHFDRLPLRRLPPDYLSFTLDTSLVLGGRWWGDSKKMHQGVAVDTVAPLDLSRPELVARAQALSPAVLRIGGTEADRVRYHLKKGPAPAETHEYCLRKADWKAIHRFVRQADLRLLFTLSAGPQDRDSAGGWLDTHARALVAYTQKKGWPMAGWELGNEVNGFPFIHGLKARVSGRQYAADFERLAVLLDELSPGTPALGPSSAVWPLIGEPNPLIPALCRSRASASLNAVSWHYYPQQSNHGPVATRRVGPKTMLQPRNLDGVMRWTRMVNRARLLCRRPDVESWMTETAHALYGGEPGISDTFASTLWWLDELGLLAREGVDKVFRQSLVGARYGLLDQDTLVPRPDYWASFLWKKLMGPVVYPSPAPGRWPKKVRVFLHGSDTDPGARTLLVINLNQTRAVSLVVDGVTGVWTLEGQTGLRSPTLTVNGVVADDGLVDDWGRRRLRRRYGVENLATPLVLPPLSATFVERNRAPTPA
jgi:heparanase 1